jgi:hypothetical protein
MILQASTSGREQEPRFHTANAAWPNPTVPVSSTVRTQLPPTWRVEHNRQAQERGAPFQKLQTTASGDEIAAAADDWGGAGGGGGGERSRSACAGGGSMGVTRGCPGIWTPGSGRAGGGDARSGVGYICDLLLQKWVSCSCRRSQRGVAVCLVERWRWRRRDGRRGHWVWFDSTAVFRRLFACCFLFFLLWIWNVCELDFDKNW